MSQAVDYHLMAEFYKLISDPNVVCETVPVDHLLPKAILNSLEKDELREPKVDEAQMFSDRAVRLLLVARDWETSWSVLKQTKRATLDYLMTDCRGWEGQEHTASFFNNEQIIFIELVFANVPSCSNTRNSKNMKLFFGFTYEGIRVTVVEKSCSTILTRECVLHYCDFPPSTIEKCYAITCQFQKMFETVGPIYGMVYMTIQPVIDSFDVLKCDGIDALRICLKNMVLNRDIKLGQAKLILAHYILRSGHRVSTKLSLNELCQNDELKYINIDLQDDDDWNSEKLLVFFISNFDGVHVEISGLALKGKSCVIHNGTTFVFKNKDFPIDSNTKCKSIMARVKKTYDPVFKYVLKHLNTSNDVSKFNYSRKRRLSPA